MKDKEKMFHMWFACIAVLLDFLRTSSQICPLFSEVFYLEREKCASQKCAFLSVFDGWLVFQAKPSSPALGSYVTLEECRG